MVDASSNNFLSKLGKIPKLGRIVAASAGLLGIALLVNKERKYSAEDEEDNSNCGICGRPFVINKLGIGLIEHYLRESDFGKLGWKSKDNPDGVIRTARNIAGEELYSYGSDSLEHYIFEGKRSKIFDKVVTLLRAATVPQVIAGDMINFIELLDIDVDKTDKEIFIPKFGDEFTEKFGGEVFNHEEHDEVDELIEDLDQLTAFCISFLHDGAYGGETMGRVEIGEGLEEEKVRYIEGSIELKFIYEDGENTMIRASYPNDPDGPVIYLPPTVEIKRNPTDERSVN